MKLLINNKEDIIKYIKSNNINFIDFRFCDLIGNWNSFTMFAKNFSEEMFTIGHSIDGSSIIGFEHIEYSDMYIVPDPYTVYIDNTNLQYGSVSLVMICDVYNIDGTRYSRDSRNIARKAEKCLSDIGIGDTFFVGPELEFFVFDKANFNDKEYNVEYNNYPYNIESKKGYFIPTPNDKLYNFRKEVMFELEQCGIETEISHHEVSPNQCEIDIKYDSLLKMADKVMIFKHIVKNVSSIFNNVVTFMPKPIYGENGNGMHVHQSLWKNNNNLFYDPDSKNMLSQNALYFIGGLIKHASSLCAFGNSTTNSYKRLVPGYEAPVNLSYSFNNRSAAIRIPFSFNLNVSRRLEFRCPDPMSNPYLLFSALLMAGIDGIINKINPGEPKNFNLYENNSNVKNTPLSLEESLDCLSKDYEYLVRGNVFTKDVIDTFIKIKTEECKEVSTRPHPHEFNLYFSK